MPDSSRPFSLPAHTQARLDALVDQIEAKPGDMIDLKDFQERTQALDVSAIMDNLPEDMTEADFIGVLRLALLTECATESYAATIQNVATSFEAGWLGRFNQRIWTPDELTHHLPYKMILMNLGFAEEELDREIKETQAREYIHYGGETPVHMTTFAMIQEYLTDNWHGLIAKVLKDASPEASYMVTRVKRRETLHSVWYRDMTALQVEADPRFVSYIAESVHEFHMPGSSLVPELQKEGLRWQQMMGADFETIFKDLFRFVQETLGNVRLTGELVMRLAAAKNVNLGPLPARHLEGALRRLGRPGYGLMGEAVLQRVGLAYMFERRHGVQDSAYEPYNSTYERVRGLLRSWIAEHIPSPAQVAVS